MLPRTAVTPRLFVLVLLLTAFPVDKGQQTIKARYYDTINQPIVLSGGQALTVGTLVGSVTSINCTGQKHAFIVSQSTLVLQNVQLFGCCQRAIVLEGPSAKLVANSVTFSHHGSSSTKAQGIAIYALDATVQLSNVTITQNTGFLQPVRDYQAAFQPACNISSSAGTVPPDGPACEAPVLHSSLVYLRRSNLTLRDTQISKSSADAVIAAEGSAQDSALQILEGSRIHNNTATWLIVADSFSYDSVGRKNILAPCPQAPSKCAPAPPPAFKAAYTNQDFIGGARAALGASGGLQGVAERLKIEQYVGQAPGGQTPMPVQLRNALIIENSVQAGLMWLRLVNTTMQSTNITFNIATPLPGSGAAPAAAAAATLHALPATAAAASAAVARLGQIGAAQGAAAQSWPAFDVCDVGVHFNAFIRVHGPAAFDMYRCNVSANIHPAGALLRVTDGMGLASVRSSTLCANTVTSVLRFEGRTWILDTNTFFASVEFMEKLRHTKLINTSKKASDYARERLAKEEERKARAAFDAPLLISHCQINSNAVFHSVVMAKGFKETWQTYEDKAIASETGSGDHPLKGQGEPQACLQQYAASWWLVDSALNNNQLILPQPIGTVNSATDLESAVVHAAQLSFVMSQSLANLADWVGNRSKCMAALAANDRAGEVEPNVHLKPAVVASSICCGFMSASAGDNFGFTSVITGFRALMTVSTRLKRNTVLNDVMWLYEGNPWLQDSLFVNNSVRNGSVVDIERCHGKVARVAVVNNTRDLSGLSPGVAVGNSHGHMGVSSVQGQAAAPAGVISNDSRLPIWRMQHAEWSSGLHDIIVSNNTGPGWGFAVDMSEYSVEGPLANVSVVGNNASGMRLMVTIPMYEGQGVTVSNATVSNNTITDEAGGLAFGRFTSDVGETMSVTVLDTVLTNNRRLPHSVATVTRGGGILFATLRHTAESGRADVAADYGTLRRISFSVKNTVIDGNTADEGGGMWSGWPVQVHNCSISNNTAVAAGGGLFLRSSPDTTPGHPAYGLSHIASTAINSNTAASGGGISCDGCSVVLKSTNISRNKAVAEVAAVGSCAAAPASTPINKTAICGAPLNSSSQPAAEAQNTVHPLTAVIAGAGGGIAANLTAQGFVAVCGSPGRLADLTGNMAQQVGGLVFVSQVGRTCPSSCPPAGWSPCEDATFTGKTGLDSPAVAPCGVQLQHVNWDTASVGGVGQLLAWAGKAPVFQMLCRNGSSDNFRDTSTLVVGDHNVSCGCGKLFAAKNSVADRDRSKLLWQLPDKLSVYRSSCWESRVKRDTAAGRRSIYRQCASGFNAVAGDTFNISVVLGQPQDVGDMGVIEADNTTAGSLGSIVLEQDRSGQLFVIGPRSRAVNSHGIARFSEMVVQPVSPPVANQEYVFNFAAGPGSPLLQHTVATPVRVKVFRCTMGRHMTVNRCVPCANASTFSLQPSFSCLPCVQGGSCERGLLHPTNGYWMHNPFVPQVIPCPLTGACVDRQLPAQPASLAPASLLAVTTSGDAAGAAVSHPRMLLAEANRTMDSVRQGGQVVKGNSSRSQGLLEYAQGLADALMQDPTLGPPMLLNITYQSILDGWQGLQCAPGYKGLMCGTCDTAYLDTSSTPPKIKRYALYLNRCVDCTASQHVTRFVLTLLFIIFWAYIGLGIVCHVKAEHRSLMDIHTSSFAPMRLSAAAASFISREAPSLPATLPEHNSVDTSDVQQGPSMGSIWSRRPAAVAPEVATEVPQFGHEGEPWGASEGMVTRQYGDHCGSGSGGDKAQVLAAYARSLHAPQQPQRQHPETLDIHPLHGSPSGGPLTSTRMAAQPHQVAEAEVPAAGEAGRSSSLQQQRRLLAPQLSAAMQRSHNMATLVAVWKVLTSYVQILAMVRYLPVLRLIPGGNILTFGDLSTFTQFAAFDCILPGPTGKLASTRILLSAFGVPALLFVTFLVAWVAMWALHRAGSALHGRLVSRSTAASYSTYGSDGSNTFSGLPQPQLWHPSRSAASSIGTQPVESAAGLPPVLDPPLLDAAAAEGAPTKQVVASASTAAVTVKHRTADPTGKSRHWSIAAGSHLSKQMQQQSSGKLSRLGSMLVVPPAVSSFLSRLPSSTRSNLERIGASRPPVPLRQYLPLRLMITAGILGYSCYSMFTSNMLGILACQPVGAVQVNSAASDLVASYGRDHFTWLQQRHEITQRDADKPELCSPGAASTSSGCQVAGLFWRQDYSVRCYAGYHMVLAIIGIVMLGLVGVLIPVVLGVLLWLNRANLKEPHFSLKYSFFYREYKSHLCFWEFVIMGRKLAFLAIFLAFTPQLVNEQTVAVLQLQLAVLLSVIVLVLHERLRPFREDMLNSLEKAVLLTLTVSFVLLACAIAVDATHALPRGRFVLLLLAGLLNGALLLVFIWRIASLFWVMFGARMVRLVRQQGGVVCRRSRHAVRRALPHDVGSTLRTHLGACCGVGRRAGESSQGGSVAGGCTNSPTCQV